MARPSPGLRSLGRSLPTRHLRRPVTLLCTLLVGSVAACNSNSSTGAGMGGDVGVGPSSGSGTSMTGSGGAGTGMSGPGVGGFNPVATGAGSTGSMTGTTTGMGAGGGNACLPDSDGDGIPDDIEGRYEVPPRDTDGDGIPDYLDLDSDNDSIPDAIEGQTQYVGCRNPIDSDGDGKPDYIDADSDNNGLPDIKEVYPDGKPYVIGKPPADTNGNGIPDYADPDNDGDSIPDTVELMGMVNGVPPDTDFDGVPDLDDVDSDGDGILDVYEQLADPTGSGIPAYRNLDSDGDGRPDNCEGGLLAGGLLRQKGDPTPPIDSDDDGVYDFLDLDSDNDGLLDTDEDKNHNCKLDLPMPNEPLADFETDARYPDTDGDGANDLVEVLLGSNPQDKNDRPENHGKYWFLAPYNLPVFPTTNTVFLKTALNKIDVGFVVDTSSSLSAARMTVVNELLTLTNALYATLPDVAIGVAGHDDFTLAPYGNPAVDQPFYIAGNAPSPTGYVSNVLQNNTDAILALATHDGSDAPQSNVAAYDRAIADTWLQWPTGSLMPASGPGGTVGALWFRPDALPIIVGISASPFHNGRRTTDPNTLHDAYSFNGVQPFPTPTIDSLISDMNFAGAKYVGVNTAGNGRNGNDPYEDMAYFVDHVGSFASPTVAFGGALCPTGPAGSFITPDEPITPQSPGANCRLVFDAPGGVGLSNSVLNGVIALGKSIKINVHIQATNLMNPAGMDTVLTWVKSIVVNVVGPNDPFEVGVPCAPILFPEQAADLYQNPQNLTPAPAGDGFSDTATNITPTQKVCFDVTPFPMNTMYPQTEAAQVFTATLTVLATNGPSGLLLPVGTPKTLAFIVPPALQ